ncbi:hypothetical protein JIN84_05165 [Luteolibacter yonseiensis]|uniref:Uncharacterized protein n=1 Tax=Luteolibacter yonseiensis TaxID=1144680 RepID=A0A934R2P4_9BACT|nr:hypothetical protein [Luteolibacter yonseiensis]MBK1814993.1 hypothetical protein [Luteolibacter yonseiensis]
MTKTHTSDPLQTVLATESKILELTERSSVLRARRSSLTIDPGKDIENEIAAKMKAESQIDAELTPLELALEHLKGGIEQKWGDVETFYLSELRPVAEEAKTIAERAHLVGTSFLEAMFPDEEAKEFQVLFAVAKSAVIPIIEKPLGTVLAPWLRGVREAVSLSSETSTLTQGYGPHSANPGIADQASFVTAVKEFIEAYPARKANVETAIAQLSSFVDHIEATFTTTDGAASISLDGGGVKVAGNR